VDTHSQLVAIVRGKEAVSMEAFAVDVHFRGIVYEVKLDASTKLDETFVGVLHAKVIEQLPEGDARRAASLVRLSSR
jgi:hypothetical protein